MAIVQHLCALALQPLLGDAADKAVQVISDHLTDHSKRLPLALQTANDHAWTAVELALVGDSWWDALKGSLFASGEEKALAARIRSFLDGHALAELNRQPAEHRHACRQELRQARQQKLIHSSSLVPAALARHLAGWRRFAAPHELAREDLRQVGAMADELRQAGFIHLSWLLGLQVDRGTSLLVTAVRYFFRRQVEEDRQLFQGLTFARLEALGDAQEAGLSALQSVLSRHGQWLDGKLGSIDEKLDGLHERMRRLEEMIEELLRRARPCEEGGDPAAKASGAAQRDPGPQPAGQPSRDWVACGGIEVCLESLFDHTAYPTGDDPNVHFLVEMEVRRGKQTAVLPADIALVLDVSASMNRPDRYPLLRKAVDEFVRRLKPGDRVGIVLFSVAGDLVMRLHAGDRVAAHLDRIGTRMDGSPILFGRHTCLAPGLEKALEVLEAARPSAVRRLYVLTDGELHDSAAARETLSKARARQIEAHVYGLGGGFDTNALKELVSGQLGGSVKPICTEQDLVSTFAHVAAVNSRLTAGDARLIMELNQQVVCGDAWSFRPLSRHLGRIRNRRFEHDLGALEEGRSYSYLVEAQLPPDRGLATPVAYVRLSWRDEHGEGQHWKVISAVRSSSGDVAAEPVARVTQAFAVLDALRRPDDRQADIAAAEARLQLALVEKRQDPKLLAALAGHLAVLRGKSSPEDMQKDMLVYLDAERRSVEADEMAQYLVADRGTFVDEDDDPVARLNQIRAQLMLARQEVLQLPNLQALEGQVAAIGREIGQRS